MSSCGGQAQVSAGALPARVPLVSPRMAWPRPPSTCSHASPKPLARAISDMGRHPPRNPRGHMTRCRHPGRSAVHARCTPGLLESTRTHAASLAPFLAPDTSATYGCHDDCRRQRERRWRAQADPALARGDRHRDRRRGRRANWCSSPPGPSAACSRSSARCATRNWPAPIRRRAATRPTCAARSAATAPVPAGRTRTRHPHRQPCLPHGRLGAGTNGGSRRQHDLPVDGAGALTKRSCMKAPGRSRRPGWMPCSRSRCQAATRGTQRPRHRSSHASAGRALKPCTRIDMATTSDTTRHNASVSAKSAWFSAKAR